jgi:hypothetical protein
MVCLPPVSRRLAQGSTHQPGWLSERLERLNQLVAVCRSQSAAVVHSESLDAMYFKTNPGEQIHLQFLRWYTGARRQTHSQIVIKAGNRLPLIQHWLHWLSRALQLSVEQAIYS